MATWMHSLQSEPPLETLSPDLGNSAQECVTLIYMIMLISCWQSYWSLCFGYIILKKKKLQCFELTSMINIKIFFYMMNNIQIYLRNY